MTLIKIGIISERIFYESIEGKLSVDILVLNAEKISINAWKLYWKMKREKLSIHYFVYKTRDIKWKATIKGK